LGLTLLRRSSQFGFAHFQSEKLENQTSSISVEEAALFAALMLRVSVAKLLVTLLAL
jgi:hypothetical protein